MKSIKCVFGFHNYKAIWVRQYDDVSWMSEKEIQQFGGSPSTSATYKCRNCGKIKVKHHYNAGYLKLEDLN